MSNMDSAKISSPSSPPKFSKKALKTMGLSLEDLLEQSLWHRGGVLKPQEFDIFWGSVNESKESPSVVLKKIVKAFTDINDGVRECEYPVQSLLNTIHFMSLVYDTRSDRVLKGMIKAWSDRKTELVKHKELFGANGVIRSLHRRIVDNEDGLETLIQQAYTLHSPEVFRLLQDSVGCSTFYGMKIIDGAFSFVFQHLMNEARDPTKRKYMSRALVRELANMQVADSSSPGKAESGALAIMHMLQRMVSRWPENDNRFLDEAISVVNSFYLWPIPVSTVAAATLDLLWKEQRAPGNAMLDHFADESRVPETYMPDTQKRMHPLFYVIDEDKPSTQQWRYMLDLKSADKMFAREGNLYSTGLSHEVQALLFVSSIFDDPDNVSKADMDCLYALTSQNVESLFHQTMDVVSDCTEMELEAAVEHRASQFERIRSQFRQIGQANGSQRISSDMRLPSLSSLIPEKITFSHQSFSISAEYSLPTIDEVAKLGYTPFSKTIFNKKLQMVLEKYRPFAEPEDPAEIRFALSGGSHLIHQVVSAYVGLQETHPQLFEGLTLRFFMVPFQQNPIVSFMARHDACRHIYVPFLAPRSLLPSVAETEPADVDEEAGSQSPIGTFMRDNVEDYVMSSSFTLPIKVYRVEGWLSNDTQESLTLSRPDIVRLYLTGKQWAELSRTFQTIPFMQRLEVGRIQAMFFQQQTQGSKPADQTKDSYIPLDLSVHFSRVNFVGGVEKDEGQRQSRKKDPLIPIDRLTLANFPVTNDPCFPADPTSNILEAYFKVAENRGKIKGMYSFLAAEPVQHINGLVLRASKPDQPFRVMVDGQHFGPFQTIRVSLARNKDGEPIIFPVATCFPIKL